MKTITLYLAVLSALLALFLAATDVRAQPVSTLPEYSTKLYLTTVVDSQTAPGQISANLLQFMRTDPAMRTLAKETVYHEWDNDTEFVKNSDWKRLLGTTRPAILLLGVTKPNGTSDIVFYRAGSNLDLKTLPTEINAALNRYKTYLRRPSTQLLQQWRQREQCGPQGCPQSDMQSDPLPNIPPAPPQQPPTEQPNEVPQLDRLWIDFPKLDMIFGDQDDQDSVPSPENPVVPELNILDTSPVTTSPWILGLSSFLGGSGLFAGFSGIRKIFQRRNQTKNQRRGALQLALWAKENGLPILVDLLGDFTVGDTVSLAQSVQKLVTTVQGGQGEHILLSLLETQLKQRLQTDTGRETILKIIEATLGIRIDRTIFSQITKELTQK